MGQAKIYKILVSLSFGKTPPIYGRYLQMQTIFLDSLFHKLYKNCKKVGKMDRLKITF